MVTVAAPLTTIELVAQTPDIVQSCIILQPTPPPDPVDPIPDPAEDNEIVVPLPPDIVYGDLPTVSIIDTTPDQMIGCIVDTGGNPQGRLDALFPAAINGDGVLERLNNHIWVYDGSTWNDVGSSPGPTVVVNYIIAPYNEIYLAEGRVRVGIEVEAVPYAFDQLTEPTDYTITLGLLLQSSQALVRVPAANTFAASSHVPQVSGGASVLVPSKNTAFAVPVPAVGAGKSINVPVIDLGFAAPVVPYVGSLATVVQAPASTANLASAAPSVTAGKSVAVPSTDFALAAHVPQVNDEPPSVVLVGAQSAATASIVLSLGTYLQNDVHLLVIETGGEGSTLTPPSPWDSVPGSPVTDVATTAGSKLQVWWQRAASNSTGTETVTIGDSGDHQLAVLYTIRGCTTTGNPWDVTATSQKTTASLVSTAPSVTTNYGQTLVFSVVTRPNDSAATTFFNAPTNASLSNLTDQGEAGTALGHGGGFASSSGVLVYPGSTGVTTFTHGTSFTSTGFTIAFRP
jgi:hypothetical protein